MSLPSILIRKSTGEILKRAPYPRADMGPIEGLDPDLEWCVIRVPFAPPEYDGRYYRLVSTEQRGTDHDTEFEHLHPWLVTYTTEKWPVAEIKETVENRESNANEGLVKVVEHLKLLALGIGTLFRRVEGLTLTQKEAAIKTRCVDLAIKVWQNHDRSQEIKTQIDSGQEPDMDTGWSQP